MNNVIIEKALLSLISNLEEIKPGDENYGNATWDIKRAKDALEEMNKPVTAFELSKKGGDWLGCIRVWIQQNFSNGDTVSWGSFDILKRNPSFDVRAFENMASDIAAAAINEYKKG